jgi:hypothetical protein
MIVNQFSKLIKWSNVRHSVDVQNEDTQHTPGWGPHNEPDGYLIRLEVAFEIISGHLPPSPISLGTPFSPQDALKGPFPIFTSNCVSNGVDYNKVSPKGPTNYNPLRPN